MWSEKLWENSRPHNRNRHSDGGVCEIQGKPFLATERISKEWSMAVDTVIIFFLFLSFSLLSHIMCPPAQNDGELIRRSVLCFVRCSNETASVFSTTFHLSLSCPKKEKNEKQNDKKWNRSGFMANHFFRFCLWTRYVPCGCNELPHTHTTPIKTCCCWKLPSPPNGSRDVKVVICVSSRDLSALFHFAISTVRVRREGEKKFSDFCVIAWCSCEALGRCDCWHYRQRRLANTLLFIHKYFILYVIKGTISSVRFHPHRDY